MMTMARGLRLGIMCSNRKRKRSSNSNSNSNSNYYDDEGDESSWLLEKSKGKVKKKRSKKKKNDDDDDDLLTRKRKRKKNDDDDDDYYDIYYDDVESTKQQQLVKNTSGRKKRTSNFRLNKCSTGFKNQEGSSHMDILLNKAQAQPQFEPQVLQNGATLNLSDLLFTKHRDFLVTYNDDGRRVQAKDLEGKVIVLHFVSLVPWEDRDKLDTASLMDIYNAIHPKGGFEVVFIGINHSEVSFDPDELNNYYDDTFSTMPWPAIPFSDIKSPEYFRTRFGFPPDWIWTDHPTSVVIDPTGVVLQFLANDIFNRYGAEAYPFSDQRIDFLISQDKEALNNHPSITTLLTSPERDYLINSENQVVPVHTLEDKVVALYFYFDYHKDPDNLTKKLKMAYEQWAKEGNFEIVLVYIHNSPDSGMIALEAESTFSSIFRHMPWLALPFKDPKCLTLQRIFNFPDVIDGPWPDPRLLIVGPQGKFFEQCGADILKEFGISAYPFTRQRAAQLEAESVRKLDLSTFWDPNAPFIQQDGTEVKLSQLVGKRIMVVIEGLYVVGGKFWQKLNARYLQMKDTNNEFEVIYISRGYGSSNDEHVTSCSWLRHPPIRQGSQIEELFWSLSLFGKYTGLLAFDRDGRVVRKTVFPSVEKENMVFPFYAGGLEKDALRRLIRRYWTNRY